MEAAVVVAVAAVMAVASAEVMAVVSAAVMAVASVSVGVTSVAWAMGAAWAAWAIYTAAMGSMAAIFATTVAHVFLATTTTMVTTTIGMTTMVTTTIAACGAKPITDGSAHKTDQRFTLNRCFSDLAGYIERSDERAALKAIVDLIEGYEAKRWPLGKDPNVPGKG